MTDDQPTAQDAFGPILRRLRELEEAHAFAEHTGDAVTAEIRELDRRVRELAVRLDRLEGRFGELRDAVDRSGEADLPEPG